MNVLVITETCFGNTARIADGVTASLRSRGATGRRRRRGLRTDARQRGAVEVVARESFFVNATEGTLTAGELGPCRRGAPRCRETRRGNGYNPKASQAEEPSRVVVAASSHSTPRPVHFNARSASMYG
jgi:hypothetical protein